MDTVHFWTMYTIKVVHWLIKKFIIPAFEVITTNPTTPLLFENHKIDHH